jgi:hypothetical protein
VNVYLWGTCIGKLNWDFEKHCSVFQFTDEYRKQDYDICPSTHPKRTPLFASFYGNQQAAENTAVICSLLGSCKECGVNPREWLNDVISKLPYYLTPKSEKKLTELLPDRWGGYRQSHDTLPTVTGMSMDNPRTVHRQTVHAT